MAPKPRDRGAFRTGERVLVPHTDKFYVAKVTKCEKREDGWYYLLHYQGWNRKWDEWVEAGGIVKYDVKLVTSEEGGTAGPAGPRGGSGAVVGGGSGGGGGGGTKRKAEEPASGVAAVGPAAKFELALPPELRQVLIADWERTIKAGQPRPLPRKPSVDDILDGYIKAVKKGATKKDGGTELEEELVGGLALYFDKALGHMLLYAAERQQYQDLMRQQAQSAEEPGMKPSTVYGGEHLLRLLTKLPELLPLTKYPSDSYNTLQLRLADFVKHLQSHRTAVFPKT